MKTRQLLLQAEEHLRSKGHQQALEILNNIDSSSLRSEEQGEYGLLMSEAQLRLGLVPESCLIDEAVEVFRHGNDTEKFAQAKYLQGWCLSVRGLFEEAREILLESYAHYLRCNNLWKAGEVLNRLCFVAVQSGRLEAAVANLRRCATIFRELKDPVNEAVVSMNHASLLLLIGKLDCSIRKYSAVRPHLSSLGHKNRATYWSMAALPFAYRGDLSSAKSAISKARVYAHKSPRGRSVYLENLGQICLLDGDYSGAEKALKEGLKTSLKIAPKSALVSQTGRLLGDLYVASDKCDLAMKNATEALAVAEKINEHIEIAACRRIFAQVQHNKGDIDKARDWYKKSLDLFNQLGTRYELAVTRYLAGTSGLYSNGEQKALLYLAREYFESEEVRPYVEKIDAALRTQSTPPARVKRPSQASAPPIITRDAAMQKQLALGRNVAESDMTVLLTGETGTGKDLLARYIHYHSGRRGEYVSVNAAAIPGEMVESELFGFAEGAFTGATRNRAGLVEQAHRGTLLLNEIADSSPQLQVKLLEVLETRCIRRLGENRSRRVDFRLIAATNQELAACVRDSRFRADLYHRLNEVHIHLPPLWERMDDMPDLLQHFLSFAGYDPRAGGSPADMHRLAELFSRHRWPGNVRELQSTVRRLWVTSKGVMSRMLMLAEQLYQVDDAQMLLAVLEETGWNRTEAARRLGVSEGTVRRRIKQFGLIQREPAE